MFRYIVAVVLAVIGAIFVGQGLGYIGGSRMTNDPFWAAVGAAMVLAAIGVMLMAWRGRHTRSG